MHVLLSYVNWLIVTTMLLFPHLTCRIAQEDQALEAHIHDESIHATQSVKDISKHIDQNMNGVLQSPKDQTRGRSSASNMEEET